MQDEMVRDKCLENIEARNKERHSFCQSMTTVTKVSSGHLYSRGKVRLDSDVLTGALKREKEKMSGQKILIGKAVLGHRKKIAMVQDSYGTRYYS